MVRRRGRRGGRNRNKKEKPYIEPYDPSKEEDAGRCQSCGMPLGQGFFAIEESGSWNPDYCRFCYKFGVFVEPELTMAEMVNRSISHMTRILGKDEIEARRLAEEVIPTLKRWKH